MPKLIFSAPIKSKKFNSERATPGSSPITLDSPQKTTLFPNVARTLDKAELHQTSLITRKRTHSVADSLSLDAAVPAKEEPVKPARLHLERRDNSNEKDKSPANEQLMTPATFSSPALSHDVNISSSPLLVSDRKSISVINDASLSAQRLNSAATIISKKEFLKSMVELDLAKACDKTKTKTRRPFYPQSARPAQAALVRCAFLCIDYL